MTTQTQTQTPTVSRAHRSIRGSHAAIVAAALLSVSTPAAAQSPAPTPTPGAPPTSSAAQSPAPAAAADGVVFIEAAKTAAAFAKGTTLVETATYKILASRREGAGVVEVHLRDTDIIYMLEGGATIVTGGTVVDGKSTGKDEVRGPRLEGGTPQTLVKGDVLIVPSGVPHWFREVQGPMLCYIVKVTAQTPTR